MPEADRATEQARRMARALVQADPEVVALQMGALRRASAKAQEEARRSQTKARREVFRRLSAKAKAEGDAAERAREEAKVEGQRPSTSELIRLIEAEATLVKDEAMAQRSYQLAEMAGPKGEAEEGGYERFILANGLSQDGGA